MQPMKILYLFIFSAVCLGQERLLQFIEITRHGARGPLNHAYDSKDQLNIMGELTEVGIHQEYQLGSQIRKEYIEKMQFLSPYYNSSEILIYSTDVNRTIMTAQAQMFGIYPEGTGPTLKVNNPDLLYPPYLDFQPTNYQGGWALPSGNSVFPVHVITPTGQIMPHACPNIQKMTEENLKVHGSLIDKIDQKYSQLYEQISQMTGESYKNIHQLMAFEDVMTSDIFQGRPLPKELTQTQIDEILALRALAWFIYQSGDPSRSLGSPTAKFITSQFLDRSRGDSSLKFILLSGHDSTIVRQQALFNISSHDCLWRQMNQLPPIHLNCEDSSRFASSLIYELWERDLVAGQNEDNHFVMIKYNGKYINLCERKSTKCDLSEFNSRISRQLGNYEEMCGIVVQNEEAISSNESLIQTLSLICILLAICTVVLAAALYKLKKQNKILPQEEQPILSPQEFKLVEMEHV